MASLTDTLPTNNYSKPVQQPVQAPDYFGQVADVVRGGLSILKDKKDAEATAASKAASEARANNAEMRAQTEFEQRQQDRAAENALAAALPQLSQADDGEINRLSSLGRQQDVELRSRELYTRIANKYSPSAAYNAFKKAGLTNALTRQYDAEEAAATAAREASAATIKSYSARADAMGIDPSLPKEVRIEMGRQSLAAEYQYNIAKQELEQSKALAEQGIATSEYEAKINSENLRTAIIKGYAPYTRELVNQISAITASVGDDAELITKMNDLGPNLQQAIAVARANAMAAGTDLRPEDIAALNAWFDTQEDLVTSAINGDLTRASTLASNLKILQDSGKLENWRIAPEYMRLGEAVGDAGTGVIVGMIAANVFVENGEERQKLQQGFIDLFNGKMTDDAKEAQLTIDSYAEVKADPSKMEGMSQKRAQRIMSMTAEALPKAAQKFIKNPNDANAQDDFFETSRSLTYAAASVTPSTMVNSRDSIGNNGYIENVLALANNKDFNGALLKLEGTNPAQAAIIRDNMSQALFNAFYIQKAKTEQLSRTMATSSEMAQDPVTGMVFPSYTGQKREFKFDRNTGNFVGKNMDGEVEKLNKLLDLRSTIEEKRGSMKSIDPKDQRLFLATNEVSLSQKNASDIPTDMSAREGLLKSIDALNTSLQQNILNPNTMVTPPKVSQLPMDLGSVNMSGVPKAIQEYLPDIQEVSKALDLPPNLITVMMQRESAGDPTAVSEKGAIGLLQLMPDTATELGVNPKDPRQNIEGGARYIKALLDKYDGDLTLALMAYNWGMGNVDKWKASGGVRNVPQETQDYVTYILGKLGYDLPE